MKLPETQEQAFKRAAFNVLLTLVYLICMFFAFAPELKAQEQIMVVPNDQLGAVQSKLDRGWSVKAVAAYRGVGASRVATVLDFDVVFVLTPPSKERVEQQAKVDAEVAARKAAEFEARRKAYLEAKNAVEKK